MGRSILFPSIVVYISMFDTSCRTLGRNLNLIINSCRLKQASNSYFTMLIYLENFHLKLFALNLRLIQFHAYVFPSVTGGSS